MNDFENGDRIERIRKMEELFDEASKIVGDYGTAFDRLLGVSDVMRQLGEYTSSGKWLEDFAADERGEIPKDLRRGVLSEDGLYDLFTEYEVFLDMIKIPDEEK